VPAYREKRKGGIKKSSTRVGAALGVPWKPPSGMTDQPQVPVVPQLVQPAPAPKSISEETLKPK
jgi:hypothetical protein